MPEEINGIGGPDDITSTRDAAKFLELDEDASPDEIDDRHREMATTVHPDTGGTTDLFLALDKATDALKGKIILEEDAPDPGGVTDDASRYDPRKSADISEDQAEEIVDAVEEMLREEMTIQEVRDKYTEETTFRELAEVIASVILQGGANLGDIGKMVGSNPFYSDSVSSATGGAYSKNSDPRYGGGGDGGGDSNYSSDPSDYMG